MSNFIGMVFATLKNEGIDTKGMSTDEAVKKYNELQTKTGGKAGADQPTPAENKRIMSNDKSNWMSGNEETDNKINGLRKLKKEQLLVTDEKGNILYEEKGNDLDAGIENYNYKNKITYHNHPEGKAYPYPSIRDFESAEKMGMKKMVVVSGGFSYVYEPDEKFESISGIRTGLSKRISANQPTLNNELWQIKEKAKEKYLKGGYKNFNDYKQDLINQNVEYMNNKLKELSKNSGYKISIEKYKKDDNI